MIILSTGWRPASAMTLILGKVISGNKEVCIFIKEKMPPAIIRNMKTLIGFLYVVKKFFKRYEND